MGEIQDHTETVCTTLAHFVISHHTFWHLASALSLCWTWNAARTQMFCIYLDQHHHHYVARPKITTIIFTWCIPQSYLTLEEPHGLSYCSNYTPPHIGRFERRTFKVMWSRWVSRNIYSHFSVLFSRFGVNTCAFAHDLFYVEPCCTDGFFISYSFRLFCLFCLIPSGLCSTFLFCSRSLSDSFRFVPSRVHTSIM